jgi:hypothetical protein
MTETAAQDATPTESYGNFGLTSPPKLPMKQRNALGEPDQVPELSGAEAVSSW